MVRLHKSCYTSHFHQGRKSSLNWTELVLPSLTFPVKPTLNLNGASHVVTKATKWINSPLALRPNSVSTVIFSLRRWPGLLIYTLASRIYSVLSCCPFTFYWFSVQVKKSIWQLWWPLEFHICTVFWSYHSRTLHMAGRAHHSQANWTMDLE